MIQLNSCEAEFAVSDLLPVGVCDAFESAINNQVNNTSIADLTIPLVTDDIVLPSLHFAHIISQSLSTVVVTVWVNEAVTVGQFTTETSGCAVWSTQVYEATFIIVIQEVFIVVTTLFEPLAGFISIQAEQLFPTQSVLAVQTCVIAVQAYVTQVHVLLVHTFTTKNLLVHVHVCAQVIVVPELERAPGVEVASNAIFQAEAEILYVGRSCIVHILC